MMGTQELGKFLLMIGGLLILLGLIFYFGKFPGMLGRLPGDIRIEKPNFSFYFPITTSILISLLLTLILFLISRFR